MKYSKQEVLGLDKLDIQILDTVERATIIKANQLALLTHTSRQAIAYRLKSLSRRGFVSKSNRFGWQLGKNWNKLEKLFSKKSDLSTHTVFGQENIVNFFERILKNTVDKTIYTIENIAYKALSAKEKTSWKKLDKVIDDTFLKFNYFLKVVANNESIKVFLESQKEYSSEYKTNRRLVYKLVPNEVLQLPYETACTTCVADDMVINLFFRDLRLEVVENKQYADLVRKFYNLAENYGKQIDVNSELLKLQISKNID